MSASAQLPLLRQLFSGSVSIRFSCCSSIAFASATAARSIESTSAACSPIASASAAAPRLHPLQLLLPEVASLQLLLSNCIRAQTQPFWEVVVHALCSQYSLQSSRFRGCSKVHILVPPPNIPLPCINHTKGILSHQGR